MDSRERVLVCNGTRVGEIFAAAGSAFQKIGELAVLLYTNKASKPTIPSSVQDKLHRSLKRFATDVNDVTHNIRKRTADQMRGELKKKLAELEERRSYADSPPTKHRKLAKPPLSPSQEQLNGSLNEADRIMAEAHAERMALLAGLPPPPEGGLMEDGNMVEEEIITTETEDNSMDSAHMRVRGIGVAGSGESSSGDDDDGIDPSRAKKRSKTRKTGRNETFMMGAVLDVGSSMLDDDDSNVVGHEAEHAVSGLVADQQMDIGLEESVEVSTEEEVVHDGLELQFAVSEEEVIGN